MKLESFAELAEDRTCHSCDHYRDGLCWCRGHKDNEPYYYEIGLMHGPCKDFIKKEGATK